MSIVKDFSFSALTAGFITVLVGFASATAIVFQAASAAGATPQMIESWVWALGLGMGLSSLILSWYYKRPIIIAWSTPGAALLATSLLDTDIQTAIGIFMFVGLLIFIVGISNMFAVITRLIPIPLASAMLAGILIQFGLNLFTSLQAQPLLVGLMLSAFWLFKAFSPRFAVAITLIVGLLVSYSLDMFKTQALTLALASPVWVTPRFDWQALIGIGIPLFIVTMTSQNLPGVATLRASGYSDQPVSPLISTTGIVNMVLAPFGGFSFNLAAITAAICTSQESHPDPSKRYIAGMSSGVFNILAGLMGSTVVSLFAAFPQAMIAALAGIALLGTIGVSLKAATQADDTLEAAVVTLLVTASGMSIWGIGSAFWGITLGMISLYVTRLSRH